MEDGIQILPLVLLGAVAFWLVRRGRSLDRNKDAPPDRTSHLDD